MCIYNYIAICIYNYIAIWLYVWLYGCMAIYVYISLYGYMWLYGYIANIWLYGYIWPYGYISLYGYTNRIRIDPPNDDRRTYGWHQEVFYTIPEARYLQTWCPILRNTTIDNGTIEIKPQSHKEGIAKQKWNEVKGRATQIIIDDDILDKYKTIQLEMEVGDLLFFDGRLAHRSGTNSTADEIRFSLVGMWHDTSHLPFRAPLPNFESRTITAKEYYKKTKN